MCPEEKYETNSNREYFETFIVSCFWQTSTAILSEVYIMWKVTSDLLHVRGFGTDSTEKGVSLCAFWT
jgi:hypothetical protein